MQSGRHLLQVCRYVEWNALTAGLVERAEDWRWSSLGPRDRAGSGAGLLLSPWPVERPANWAEEVNRPWTESDLARVRRSVRKGLPLGEAAWVERTAKLLGLETALRSPGRPRKQDVTKSS